MFVQYLKWAVAYFVGMDIELRHLRYFIAVAEELSFTRAARRLHMAQPPLSTQIRRLEEELGVGLFDRSRRSVRLTAAGEALLAEARRLLIAVEQTLSSMQRIGRGEVGRLTLGFVPSASNNVVPQLVRAYRRRFPDVDLYLREMAPDDLIRGLRAGGIDVCLLYLPFADPSLEVRVVAREALVAALPADHPLAARERLTMRDLAGEPFVLPAQHRMPGLLAQVNEACRRADFTPTPVQTDVWLMQTVIALVSAGMGVALVPASVEALHRTGVTYRRIEDVQPSVELGAVWRRDDASPLVAGLLGALMRP